MSVLLIRKKVLLTLVTREIIIETMRDTLRMTHGELIFAIHRTLGEHGVEVSYKRSRS